MRALKTVFMGTPDICLSVLSALKNNDQIDLIQVVSMPDRPAGRGKKLKSPEVIEFCKNKSIPFFQSEKINNEEFVIQKWKESKVDLIIVFAFAQFLNKTILNLPQVGCFNIHTSLLPKYRGAAPIQYAILNQEKETGVSIQKMVSKMDAGDIVHSKKITILENETGGELYLRLKEVAAVAINEFIDLAIKQNLHYTPQDESLVSFAPTIKKEEGLLDFKNTPFAQIQSKVLAFDPWPGTYCYLNKKRLKVLEIEMVKHSLKPGEVSKELGLVIGCLDGSLRLKKVQLEGKKPCSDIELLNGIREEIKINEL